MDCTWKYMQIHHTKQVHPRPNLGKNKMQQKRPKADAVACRYDMILPIDYLLPLSSKPPAATRTAGGSSARAAEGVPRTRDALHFVAGGAGFGYGKHCAGWSFRATKEAMDNHWELWSTISFSPSRKRVCITDDVAFHMLCTKIQYTIHICIYI